MTAYVSEFVAAVRHPDHEKGQESAFHVTLTDWVADITGTFRPQSVGPMGPSEAAKYGFTLEKILGEVGAEAVRVAAEYKAAAEKAAAEAEVAKAEWSQMASEVQVAKEGEAAALRIAGQAVEEKQAAERNALALVAELDALKAPSDEPANPLLNKLTFGVFGN